MSNLTVQGLLSARKKELRNQAERQHHINNELQTMTWTKEDKAGRCYTYRGVLGVFGKALASCALPMNVFSGVVIIASSIFFALFLRSYEIAWFGVIILESSFIIMFAVNQ